MLNQFFAQLKAVAAPLVNEVRNLVLEWTKPLKETLVGGVAHDVIKTKTDLVVESMLLRQQLIILKRQVKRPQLKGSDRLLLVVLASKLQQWRQALLIIKPETLWAGTVNCFVWSGSINQLPQARSLVFRLKPLRSFDRWQVKTNCGVRNASRANCSNSISNWPNARFRSGVSIPGAQARKIDDTLLCQ